jgi:hypothetical protein
MGDLLGSASLLLTLIALLYSLWYPEIIQALNIKVKNHAADRVQDHEHVRSVYVSRAIPLAVAAVALTVVFAPDVVRIIVTSVINVSRKGWLSTLDYDASSTSLVLVTVGAALFSVHLFCLCRKLRTHVGKLDPRFDKS